MKCIICAIAKLENDYIYEWAQYHLNLGFSEIHIYDNNDQDGERISDVLANSCLQNNVIIHDVRGLRCMQKPVYQECYETEDFDWCAFIDVDEFITFNEASGVTSINDLLNRANGYEAMHLNWMCYGDDSMVRKTNGGVLERFRNPIKPLDFKVEYVDKTENSHIKTIVRKGLNIDWVKGEPGVFNSNPHTPYGLKKVCDAKGNPMDNLPWGNIDFDIAYIRHYVTMTIEEYRRKDLRKAADTVSLDHHCITKFFQYNSITIAKLLYAKRYYSSVPLLKILKKRFKWWSINNHVPTAYLYSTYREYVRKQQK